MTRSGAVSGCGGSSGELGIRHEQRGAEGDNDQRGQPERCPPHELARPPLQWGGDPGAHRVGRDLQHETEGDEAAAPAGRTRSHWPRDRSPEGMKRVR